MNLERGLFGGHHFGVRFGNSKVPYAKLALETPLLTLACGSPWASRKRVDVSQNKGTPNTVGVRLASFKTIQKG